MDIKRDMLYQMNMNAERIDHLVPTRICWQPLHRQARSILSTLRVQAITRAQESRPQVRRGACRQLSTSI